MNDAVTKEHLSNRTDKLNFIKGYFQDLYRRANVLSTKANYILSKVGDSDWLSKVTYELDNTNHQMTLTGYTGSQRPDIPTFATVNNTYYDVNKSNVKTVTISSNGGSDLPKTTFECISGCTLGVIFTGLGAPTKNNYVFDGWYTDASGGSAVSATTVISSNTTIYAHWKYMPQTFTIGLPKVSFTYHPDDGGNSIWMGEVSIIKIDPPTINANPQVDVTVAMNYRIVTTKGTSNESVTWKCNAGSSVFNCISGNDMDQYLYNTHVTSTPRDSVTGSASGYTYSGGTFTRN